MKRFCNYILSIVLCWIGANTSIAQVIPDIKSSVDTTSIRIGEQINFEVQIEVDSTSLIVFPEGQTFTPLEVIESYKVDTSYNEARIKLIKKYGLTQFDSGSYKLPRQRILINEKEFFTDSFRIEVDNVKVDTTVQKLYDIKPAIELPKDYSRFWKYLLWILPLVLAIGGFLFWLLRRNKKRAEAEKYLPPFEQALASLKELDEKGYIQTEQIKEYYSELTDTIRRYYDEKVYDHSMESTTEELIARLELERESGNLEFTSEIIASLKDILQRADLVKFARTLPPEGKPQADRLRIEQVVKETKEILPEPTEEELLKDEEYRLMLSRKRKRKLVLTGTGGVLGILFLALGLAIGLKGYNEVRDFILGNETRALAEGNWITSEYGFPSVVISTPQVLERQDLPLPEDIQQQVDLDFFTWSSKLTGLSIGISQAKYPSETEVDIEKAVNGSLSGMESQGMEFNIVKNEAFKTPNGAEGAKTFGNGSASIKPGSDKRIDIEYVILTFNAETILQQVILTWNPEDEYSERIAQRVIASVELQKEQQQTQN